MKTESSATGQLWRALSFATPQRTAIAAVLLLTLAVAVIGSLEPLAMKYIVDGLMAEEGLSIVWVGLGALTALTLFREGASGASNWLTWRTRIRLQYALLEATIERLHRMLLEVQHSEGVGAILKRLDRSIQGFVASVTPLLFNVLPALAYLVIAILIMLQMDWRLALLVLLFAPLPAVLAAIAAPEQRRRERTMLDRWAQIYSRFTEVLSGIVTVRSFAMARHVGVVLQDPLLFNDTVRANIAYAHPNASHHELESAARAANVHEFITALPDGYETLVGERGARLSVGEHQRISIARALIKELSIVVLDEATAITPPGGVSSKLL